MTANVCVCLRDCWGAMSRFLVHFGRACERMPTLENGHMYSGPQEQETGDGRSINRMEWNSTIDVLLPSGCRFCWKARCLAKRHGAAHG